MRDRERGNRVHQPLGRKERERERERERVKEGRSVVLLYYVVSVHIVRVTCTHTWALLPGHCLI